MLNLSDVSLVIDYLKNQKWPVTIKDIESNINLSTYKIKSILFQLQIEQKIEIKKIGNSNLILLRPTNSTKNTSSFFDKWWIRFSFLIIFLAVTLDSLNLLRLAIDYYYSNIFDLPTLLLNVLIGLAIGCVISLFFLFILININLLKKDFNPPMWGQVTICLMIVLFFVGNGFIKSEFGRPELRLDLHDKENPSAIWGYITCSDDSKNLLTNSLVICSLNSSLNNISSAIHFDYQNGSQSDSTHFSNISFIAPPQVKRISFDIIGTNENGIAVRLVTGGYITFFNETELRTRSDTSLVYELGFLGVIFFSVPAMMLNLRELFKKDYKSK